LTGIRVLIADDEPEVRAALAELIAAHGSFELAGAAGDADEAIALAREIDPDVVLLDVKMPGGGGRRAASEITRSVPRTRVLALSAFEDAPTVREMLRAGAIAYLVKGAPPEEILQSIEWAARGEPSLPVQLGVHAWEGVTPTGPHSSG
jgi:DNA-binding NarL/FixJ family response regulator